jgi:lipid II:glycine glycyltransferase (peptidoglycan interpeptide bridge formation enzyme)
MSFQFREITDKNEWNKFLENYPTLESGVPVVTFVQSWEWANFQKSVGNDSLNFGIFDNSGKQVGAGLGIIVKAKRGKYLYFRNGPVLDWKKQELVNLTINYMKDLAKEKGLWFARMSPLVERESQGAKNIAKMNFPKFQMNEVEALDTWMMDLSPTEDELFNNIKKKNRYYIRKAAKPESENGYGVETFISQKPEYLNELYKIYEDTYKRQKWHAYSFNYVKNEFESFAESDRATIILMKYKGKFIAGGMFLNFANQMFYHLGASLSKYQKISASYLMLWEAIKYAKKSDVEFFNLWGIAPSDKPDHPWAGLTRFKKKFPGFEQKWLPARDIPVSKLYWLTNIYDRIDKYRKGY